MSLFEKKNDALDRAASQIRAEDVDPAVVEQAAARVWERLSRAQHEMDAEPQMAAAPAPQAAAVETAPPHTLRACDDFQALIPAYLRGELPPARALLVEDHTRSCVPCRRALREAREGRTAPARPAAATTVSRMRPVWMSLAALLVLGLGAGLFILAQEMLAGGSQMAKVESVEGDLFRIDGNFSEPIRTGEVLAEGEEIRTAKGSTALVRMADGSLIEMNERAGLYLDGTRKGNVIHLDRGRIIVEAAKQRQRHLFVATRDARVSVTGTIFSVNTGTKGSRVSVVEGEVHVNQAKKEDVLHPGGQVTTHVSVAAVPVRQEIAWSRNAAQYEELLAELTAAGQDIDARVARPGLRYSTHLLDLAPAATRAWVGLPNLGTNLAETQRLLDQKIDESPALQQWWSQTIGSGENDQKFHEMIERLGALGQHLGNEVAIAMAGAGEDCRPLLLAEVTNENAFRAVLEQEIARIDERGHLEIVDDPATVPAGESEDKAWLWIGGGLFVATPDGNLLRTVAANAGGAANPFTNSAFHGRVAQEYRDGANWLFSADLAAFVGEHMASESPEGQAAAERSGFRDLQYFVINRREIDGTAETRAAVTFTQARRGVASWLAAPAPMGGLAYFSPDAHLAAAFVVKQPTSLIDDLLAMSPEAAEGIEKLRTEHGIDLRADLAAPMGGEIAFGVDGPLVPEPSWKMVAEVYDSARLQSTIERMVAHLNDELRREGKPSVQIASQDAGGHTFYTLIPPGGRRAMAWVYDDGYIVAAPSRALLERALAQRESGVSLANTPKFRGLLGSDGQVNVSAFYYQNLAEVAKTAGKMIPQGALEHAGPGSMASFLIGDGPSLIYAYAEEDRILFASTNKSPLGLNLQTLSGFGSVLGMMDQAHEQAEAAQQEEAR